MAHLATHKSAEFGHTAWLLVHHSTMPQWLNTMQGPYKASAGVNTQAYSWKFPCMQVNPHLPLVKPLGLVQVQLTYLITH